MALFDELEWLAVKFTEDSIFYMCPNFSKTNMKVGSNEMIKWKDGYKYKTKILKKGSKFSNFICLQFILLQ